MSAGRSLLALPVCGAWDAATAMSLLTFAVYAVSCVLAGLDIKDGRGLVKPRGEQPCQMTGSRLCVCCVRMHQLDTFLILML